MQRWHDFDTRAKLGRAACGVRRAAGGAGMNIWLGSGLTILAVGTLAGCSGAENPAKVCASAETQRGVFSLLYDTAEEALPSLTGSLGAEDLSAIRNQLEAMRHEPGLLAFSFSTLEGVDKSTKKISCSGKLAITLPLQNQVRPFLDRLSTLVAGAGALELTAPAQLTTGAATTTIDYTRQPSASGDQTIIGESQGQEAVGSLILIALARVQVAREAAAAAAAQVQSSAPASDASQAQGPAEATPAAEADPAAAQPAAADGSGEPPPGNPAEVVETHAGCHWSRRQDTPSTSELWCPGPDGRLQPTGRTAQFH